MMIPSPAYLRRPSRRFALGSLLLGLALPFTALAAGQDDPDASVTLRPSTAANAKVVAKKTAKAGPADAGATKSDDKAVRATSGSEQAIVVLVNDEPITGYEVQQRASMLAGGAVGAKAQEIFRTLIKQPGTNERLKAIFMEVVKANPGKTKEQVLAIFDVRKKEFGMALQKQAMESAKAAAFPSVKKAALDELIDERLKAQEAKRLNVLVGDDEVDKVIDSIAQRNKMDKAQLAAQLGGNLDAMKSRVRSTLSFNEVVKRKFGAQIAISGKDVDRFVASSQSGSEDETILILQRITVAVPAKIEQGGIAQRMQEAENIRANFKDCKSTAAIAKGNPGAKFEDVGRSRLSGIPEPTRTLLASAKDGEMLPPSVGEGGVELWAVCGREVMKADEQKRTQAEGELKQKEFELLAKRYIKDLRTDAHIEYR